MWKSIIGRRLGVSFIAVVIFSISLLGYYLLNVFYRYNLDNQMHNLANTGQVIRVLLHSDLTNKPLSRHTTEINQQVKEILAKTGYRLTVITPQGNVILDSQENISHLDNHAHRKEIQEVLEGADIGSSVRHSGTLDYNMLYVAIPVYNQNLHLSCIIRISTSLASIETTYNHLRNSIIIALILTIILALIISSFLANRQIKPIHDMTRDATAIINGDLSREIKVNTHDEFSVLANTINQLTSKLLQQIADTKSLSHQQSLILENMDNSVLLLDKNCNLVLANLMAQELFSLPEDYVGKNIIANMGYTTLASFANKVIRKNHSIQRTLTLKLPTNTKTFTIFLAPIETQQTTYVLCVFHDISLLQEIAQRQTEFVSNAAHELATPLTSIAGYAETLLDDDFSKPELSKKFINTIFQEAQRMNSLLTNLLQLAKLENADYLQNIPLEKISLSALVENIAEHLVKATNKKHQQLTLHLSLSEKVLVEGNSTLLYQAIYNILENASKYTPDGGKISLSCVPAKDPKFAEITITDTGIGIAPNELPLIFQRFYRVDKARARASGGNGVGLSLAKFIIELFSGTITVTSQLQQGTTFTIKIPIIK